MLPLPWWILGTVPTEDDEIEDTSTDDGKIIPSVEVQESLPTTPISMFRTPSASPYAGAEDSIRGVVNYSSFLNGAKRRSSAVLEGENSKKKKTGSRKSAGSENRKFERKETEIMNKTIDGSLVFDGDSLADDTFYILESEHSRPNSPMLLNKSAESLADKEALNQSIRPDEHEDEPEVEEAFNDSPTRDYPMFFTSFNDTTVLFNTTITGDIDAERDQKNAAVGDWVFKGNKILEENKASSSSSPVFKHPANRSKPQKPREKTRYASVESNASTSSRRTRVTKKAAKEETTPNKQAVPEVERRRTPSRKAKTYKSMRES